MLGQVILEPEAKGKIDTDPVLTNNYWKSIFIECEVQGMCYMHNLYIYILFMRYM